MSERERERTRENERENENKEKNSWKEKTQENTHLMHLIWLARLTGVLLHKLSPHMPANYMISETNKEHITKFFSYMGKCANRGSSMDRLGVALGPVLYLFCSFEFNNF